MDFVDLGVYPIRREQDTPKGWARLSPIYIKRIEELAEIRKLARMDEEK